LLLAWSLSPLGCRVGSYYLMKYFGEQVLALMKQAGLRHE
jgi:hypothetical protein